MVRLNAGRLFDGLGPEILPAVERAAVQKHLSEPAIVGRRAEQPAVGGRVMFPVPHRTGQQRDVRRLQLAILQIV